MHVQISREHARRFVLAATRLQSPGGQLEHVLRHLGYVQLDPLNVCGRMQDLILRHRVTGYRPGALLDYIHGTAGQAHAPREGFEHYIPNKGILVAWPGEAYPWIRAHLQQSPATGLRRTFTAQERQLADWILREISERGPLRSDDIEHAERGATVWGTQGRLVKVILEKLFANGELLISRRKDFRRVYDLAERVISPPSAASLPRENELRRWTALLTLKQRRLVSLRRQDVQLVQDQIQAVRIDDAATTYCLRSDLGLLEATAPDPEPSQSGPARLLAPLDPVIYDRALTSRLWSFDFIWEVYTPPEKRTRGYYSLPVLAGLEIVGDVEPRVDWQEKRMTVRSRRVRRGISTAAAVADLAQFLGVKPPKNAK